MDRSEGWAHAFENFGDTLQSSQRQVPVVTMGVIKHKGVLAREWIRGVELERVDRQSTDKVRSYRHQEGWRETPATK
jgi:hypothetical protein